MKISRRNTSRIPDAALAELYAQTGRAEYAGELQLRYLPLLYGLCLNRKGADENAAEVCRLLLADFPSWLSTASGKDFGGWLYARSLEWFEKRGAGAKHQAAIHERLTPGAVRLMRGLAAEEKEAAEIFAKKETELTRSQKECIKLFFMEGLSFEDIASQAGYLTADVREHIARGLNILSSETPPAEKARRTPAGKAAAKSGAKEKRVKIVLNVAELEAGKKTAPKANPVKKAPVRAVPVKEAPVKAVPVRAVPPAGKSEPAEGATTEPRSRRSEK